MKRTIKKPLLIFIIFTLFLVSCSSKPSSTSIEPTANKANETVSNFFYYIQKGDLNKASEYLDKSRNDYNNNLKFQSSFQEDIIKKVFSKVEYKTVTSSYKNNTAEITLEITSPNLSEIYSNAMSKSLDPLIDKYLNGNEKDKVAAKNEAKKIASSSITTTLGNSNFPKTTNRVKLTLSETNGNWVLNPNEDFLYALTGGMPQLLRQVSK